MTREESEDPVIRKGRQFTISDDDTTLTLFFDRPFDFLIFMVCLFTG